MIRTHLAGRRLDMHVRNLGEDQWTHHGLLAYEGEVCHLLERGRSMDRSLGIADQRLRPPSLGVRTPDSLVGTPNRATESSTGARERSSVRA